MSQRKVDICIIRLTTRKTRVIHVVCIYNPPRTRDAYIDLEFWEQLFWHLFALGNVIICRDFNAHSTLWFLRNQKPNDEGIALASAVVDTGFVILNDGSSTWALQDIYSLSIIDLVFVSPSLALDICCRTNNYKFSSDHFPIFIDIIGYTNAQAPCRPVLSCNKIDWNRFRSSLLDKIPNYNVHNAAPLERYIYERLLSKDKLI